MCTAQTARRFANPLFAAVAALALVLPLAVASANEPAPASSTAKAAEKSPEKSAEKATTAGTERGDELNSQGGLSEAEVARAFKQYRKQVRDGDVVFCRKEAPLGTRIGKTVCYSEDQVLARARAERDVRAEMGTMNICGSAVCAPSN